MAEKNSTEETYSVNQEQTDYFLNVSGKRLSTEEWNAFNQLPIEQFRASHGMFVESVFKGIPVLLLTSIGARSGKSRVNPLCYTRDGDGYVVVASKVGAPENPAWYYNLIANPVVTVEVGSEIFQAKASVMEGSERDHLFDVHAVELPGFADYQRHTTRIFPVIVLHRIS